MRALPVLTAATAAVALGAAVLAFRADADAASADARYERLGAALDTLDDDLEQLRTTQRRDSRSLAQMARAVEELSALRAAPDQPAVRPAAADAPQPVTADTGTDADTDFEELRRRVLAGEATEAESASFWQQLKTSDRLPAVIGRLEAAVAADAEDTAARLRLGRAYVAKLYSVPDGPARGAWAAKAERQWDEVLERDPTDWEARFSLASSYSQWPAMFGKGPAAIGHLEALQEQQESRAPQAHEAAVYHLLADLRRRAGNPEAALEALEAGVRRHPTDERLRAALAQSRE